MRVYCSKYTQLLIVRSNYSISVVSSDLSKVVERKTKVNHFSRVFIKNRKSHCNLLMFIDVYLLKIYCLYAICHHVNLYVHTNCRCQKLCVHNLSMFSLRLSIDVIFYNTRMLSINM